ncbi:MAG: DNA repair protein RadC [Candidatus Omnitrophota bacterium]
MKTKKSSGIGSWPVDDRPREKLLTRGARSLSNSELLAILIRSGTRGVSAIDLGRQLMEKFKTFRDMAHIDQREWRQFKGLGDSKVAMIQAALEIGRRFREDEVRADRRKVTSAQDVADILMPQMRDLKTEVFKIVYLDSSNRIIDIEDASKGTVNHAMPIVREIIHSALQKFSAAIICVHNHPSGNVSPSKSDMSFSEEIIQAGKLMRIKVLDHLIMGYDRYYSFDNKYEFPFAETVQ